MHRYPPELDEAIWALMKAGCGSSEIKLQIDSGEIGVQVGKPIPLRTVQHRIQMLRRARGEPEPELGEDGLLVDEYAETVAGEVLAIARQHARKIRAAAKGRSVTVEEARVLENLSRTINTLRTSRLPKRRVGRLPGQTTAPRPERLLAMLAREERAREEREGRSIPAADNGTS
jgi:hypothetical protein